MVTTNSKCISFFFHSLKQNVLKMCSCYKVVQECLLRRHSSPYCCWSLWWISADGTFSPRNLITMRCSTLRGTFCSLITLATPRQDWTGSNPSRREGGGSGFTLSRSHSCCAVRLVYIQISPSHIWTTLYNRYLYTIFKQTLDFIFVIYHLKTRAVALQSYTKLNMFCRDIYW